MWNKVCSHALQITRSWSHNEAEDKKKYELCLHALRTAQAIMLNSKSVTSNWNKKLCMLKKSMDEVKRGRSSRGSNHCRIKITLKLRQCIWLVYVFFLRCPLWSACNSWFHPFVFSALAFVKIPSVNSGFISEEAKKTHRIRFGVCARILELTFRNFNFHPHSALLWVGVVLFEFGLFMNIKIQWRLRPYQFLHKQMKNVIFF